MACRLCIWLMIAMIVGAKAGELWSPAPDDLHLDDELAAKSDALGHFAWGVFLRLQGAPLAESHGLHLSAALLAWPESELLLRELVAPWVQRRDYAGACDILEPVARQRPEAADLQVFLGLMYHAAERFPEAIAHFERLYYQLGHRLPVVVRELSALYWRDRQFVELQRLLKHARRDRELRHDFVVPYAATLFHHGMASRPAADNVSDRARQSHRRQALRQARQAADRLAGQPGADENDIATLADVFASQERWSEAAAILERGAELFPDEQLAFLLRAGQYRFEAGQPEVAGAWLARLDPDQVFDAGLLVQAAQLAIRLDRQEEAVNLLQRALPLAPRAVSIRQMYGYLLLQLGRPRDSIETLNAVSLLPPIGYLIKAKALAELKLWQEALEVWRLAGTAARQAKDDSLFTVDYWLTGAWIAEETGAHDQAIAAAEQAVELAPDSPTANNFLGYVLADHNLRLDEAEQYILLAVAARPDSDAFLDSLAWVYYRQGRLAAALVAMSDCLRHAPEIPDPVILDHAGDIFAATGNPHLARLYWWMALDAEPDDPEPIRRKLDGS